MNSERASSSSTEPDPAPAPYRVTTAGRLLTLVPGVRRVRAQIRPYAEAWAGSNRLALREAGPLWLVVGDSTAQGLGASAYDRGWVGQLLPRLRADGQAWRVVNLSRTGDRIRNVLDEQLPLAERLGLEPSLTTVAAGANDVRKGRHVELEPALEELLRSLPKGAVVATIPGRPSAVQPFNELIHVRATSLGLRVAETFAAMAPPWRGKLASDFFHPNDTGYAMWAAAFAAALELA